MAFFSKTCGGGGKTARKDSKISLTSKLTKGTPVSLSSEADRSVKNGSSNPGTCTIENRGAESCISVLFNDAQGPLTIRALTGLLQSTARTDQRLQALSAVRVC